MRIALSILLLLSPLAASAQTDADKPRQESPAPAFKGCLLSADPKPAVDFTMRETFREKLGASAVRRDVGGFSFFLGTFNKPPGSPPVNVGRSPSMVSIGVGIALDEGKPLETLLWGGGGAILGSFAGPVGTVIGAAVGAACGYVVGTLCGPKHAAKRSSAQPGRHAMTAEAPAPALAPAVGK